MGKHPFRSCNSVEFFAVLIFQKYFQDVVFQDAFIKPLNGKWFIGIEVLGFFNERNSNPFDQEISGWMREEFD
jgi:hypothetical protein